MPTITWGFDQGHVEPVVWLDVLALECAWALSDDYIGRGGEGSLHGDRYARVGAFIRNARRLGHPHLNLKGGAPVFTDGRHRFAWLRDHGATAIPVTTSPRDAPILEAQFGTGERDTLFDGAG